MIFFYDIIIYHDYDIISYLSVLLTVFLFHGHIILWVYLGVCLCCSIIGT